MGLQEFRARMRKHFKGVDPFPEDMEGFLEQFLPQLSLKEETLQSAFAVSAREMEELYAEGYEHYQKEHYGEAVELFRLLVTLNPFEKRSWMGLGASLQLLEDYEKALHGYAVAALLDGEDPYPHFHAYECYQGLANEVEGSKALALARKKAAQKPLFNALRQEIESLQQGAVHG